MWRLRRIKQVVWTLIAAGIFFGILSVQIIESRAISRINFSQEGGQFTFYKDNGYRLLHIMS